MENHDRKINRSIDVSFRDVQEYRRLIDGNSDLIIGIMRYGPAKLPDAKRFVDLVNVYKSYSYETLTRVCEGRDILDRIQRHALSFVIDEEETPKSSNYRGRCGNPRTGGMRQTFGKTREGEK